MHDETWAVVELDDEVLAASPDPRDGVADRLVG